VPQLAISETQKYGHVTYFWNGNRGGMFDERSRRYIEIPSDTLPVRRAAVDEGRRDHRSPDRRAAHRQAPLRARQLRQRRHGRPHRPPRRRHRAVEAVDIQLAPLATASTSWAASWWSPPITATPTRCSSARRDGHVKRLPSGAPVVKTSHSLNPGPLRHPRPAPSRRRIPPRAVAGGRAGQRHRHLPRAPRLRAPRRRGPSLLKF
jgi:2,3-bisphosphoglycerate-independent phosphoglycerate mutase